MVYLTQKAYNNSTKCSQVLLKSKECGHLLESFSIEESKKILYHVFTEILDFLHRSIVQEKSNMSKVRKIQDVSNIVFFEQQNNFKNAFYAKKSNEFNTALKIFLFQDT